MCRDLDIGTSFYKIKVKQAEKIIKFGKTYVKTTEENDEVVL